MKRKRTNKALQRVVAAEKAFAAGNCLPAGKAIDQAYVALGQKMNKGTWRRLKKVDEKFERACVLKHPRGRR